MLKITRKVLLLLAVFLFAISYAPPLGFSYLEPVVGSDHFTPSFSSFKTQDPELSSKQKPDLKANFANLEYFHELPPEKVIKQTDPEQYFQVGPDITKDELRKYDDEREKRNEQKLGERFFQVSQALSNLAAGTSSTNFLTNSINKFGHHAFDSWWMEKIGGLPDWAKRIELEWALREDTNFDFEALTVQPLHESSDKKSIFFTQFSVSHLERIQEYRTTTNLGVGFRRLLSNNTILLGSNVFFDREWDNDHNRIGGGIEARWNNFDLYANVYKGLSGGRKIVGDTFEEALDGTDIELTSQIPYLPWMRIRGKGFWWETTGVSKDLRGWSASTEMDITRNFLVEFGVLDDNFNDREFFAKLRFTFDHNRPTAISNTVDSKPFRMRDMQEHKLDRVRRENKVIVQRKTSGVVIVRGS
jgi:hypothetical protein